MAGFKRLPDGSPGQAELMGSTRPGDVLAEVDGVVVSDMSFDKVREMFRNSAVVVVVFLIRNNHCSGLVASTLAVPLFERCVSGVGEVILPL